MGNLRTAWGVFQDTNRFIFSIIRNRTRLNVLQLAWPRASDIKPFRLGRTMSSSLLSEQLSTPFGSSGGFVCLTWGQAEPQVPPRLRPACTDGSEFLFDDVSSRLFSLALQQVSSFTFSKVREFFV